jgi:hypothetical protein
MAPGYSIGIDMFSSPIFTFIYNSLHYRLFIYIFLFLAFDQLAMSIYLCTHFFAFYRSTGLPPPQVPGFYAGDEAFAPDVAI